ncbi:hypothetical protein OBBRIDRAFT_803681 [Obba rivulosa]|uniref:Uncharacterized protein n=1 Tax=Obba rivulosa TaxID=1052685 RepID=A0A8E2ATU6_9APHY|nr:hypothetical protein OBBRIDRAFT_803681 [Obba rivulosa]
MCAVTAAAAASPAPASLKTVVVPAEDQLDISALFVADGLFAMPPLRSSLRSLLLTERSYSIIDDMAKLVDSAVTVRPFTPKLLPDFIMVESTIGDPEARSVVARAIATLQAGESTFMRAIINCQVEGFVSPDEVRTFYVEHDIGSEADTTVLESILSDKRVQASPGSRTTTRE